MDNEKMMERILELEKTNKEMNDLNESLKIENESFRDTIHQHENKITELKRLNMKYFERLTMETKTEQKTPIVNKTEEVPKSWDEFLNEW